MCGELALDEKDVLTLVWKLQMKKRRVTQMNKQFDRYAIDQTIGCFNSTISYCKKINNVSHARYLSQLKKLVVDVLEGRGNV